MKLICKYLLLLFFALPTASHGQGLSEINSFIESNISAGNPSVAVYFFLLFGGIMASLLPCTYPLYPITANIIKGRATGSKRFTHPLTYYFGLAFIYLIFGIVASLSGGAFNQILRLPLTNLVIGILIFFMGLSSMGLIHLRMFSGDGGDTKQKGLTGTFILGMGAGLLASSCVGPIVVSVLLGVASGAKEIEASSIILSSLKMLSFGLGLGLPFLLIGAFGISLPKSGKWMQYVQYLLSGLIIFFSYSYLEKGLSGFGFKPSEIVLILAGALLLTVSSYLLQPTYFLPSEKVKRSLLILSTIVGGLILLRGIIPQNSAPTIAAVQVGEEKVEKKGKLTWYLDKEAAYKEAKAKGKKVFVDFYASWCTNCKEFAKLAETDPELVSSLKEAVLLKVYDNDPQFASYQKDKRFAELNVGLPFFVITDKDENLIFKTNDYLKTDEMSMFLVD